MKWSNFKWCELQQLSKRYHAISSSNEDSKPTICEDKKRLHQKLVIKCEPAL